MASFLEELQRVYPLREGIEGHRSILREIYRAGHISLHRLALVTRIALPLLAGEVNFLIEKEILARIPEGILYTEKGMTFIERELHFYGFGLGRCEKCQSSPIYLSPRWDETIDHLEEVLQQRPVVDTTIDQAYALPETSLKRAIFLYQVGALEGKAVACLGDDDYTSVAIAMLYSGFFPEEPVLIPETLIVFDIDERHLEKIRSIGKNIGVSITCEHWDYRTPVPDKWKNKLDTILLDPPYSLNGLRLTLSRAIELLRVLPGSGIFLSFAHRSAEETLEFEQLILEMGLAIMEMYPQFNRYEGATILGNSTQMIRLSTTSTSRSVIAPDVAYHDPIYTGELRPSLRIYYCTVCGFHISVGQNTEYATIETLKANGCPHCHQPGPFKLEEKISF